MENEAAQKKTDKKEETVSKTAVHYLDHDKLCLRICLVVFQVEAKKSEVKDLANEEEDDDDDDDDEDMVVRVKGLQLYC